MPSGNLPPDGVAGEPLRARVPAGGVNSEAAASAFLAVKARRARKPTIYPVLATLAAVIFFLGLGHLTRRSLLAGRRPVPSAAEAGHQGTPEVDEKKKAATEPVPAAAEADQHGPPDEGQEEAAAVEPVPAAAEAEQPGPPDEGQEEAAAIEPVPAAAEADQHGPPDEGQGEAAAIEPVPAAAEADQHGPPDEGQEEAAAVETVPAAAEADQHGPPDEGQEEAAAIEPVPAAAEAEQPGPPDEGQEEAAAIEPVPAAAEAEQHGPPDEGQEEAAAVEPVPAAAEAEQQGLSDVEQEESPPPRDPAPSIPQAGGAVSPEAEQMEAATAVPLPSVAQPEDVGPPTEEEGARPSAVRPLEVYQEWGLPTLQEAEAQMPEADRKGKEWLAAALADVGAAPGGVPDLESPENMQVVKAVTKILTHGKAEDPVGQIIYLENVRPFVESEKDIPETRSAKITEILGLGTNNLVLLMVDEETKEEFALRIAVRLDVSAGPEVLVMKDRWQRTKQMQSESLRLACGGDSASVASERKGIAVPLYTAQLGGLPDVTHHRSSLIVFREAQVVEDFWGDLAALWTKVGPLSAEARQYVARRLLLQVLHLQAAGVSHADLKLSNCFMRKDGSFLLGDFDGATPVGKTMGPEMHVTLAYVEPELFVAAEHFCEGGPPVIADSRSDMWSLGVVLYELFTDGELPYEGAPESGKMRELLLKGLPSHVVGPALIKAGVPRRWAQLIRKLLEVKRENRITAKDVIEKFPDLFGGKAG